MFMLQKLCCSASADLPLDLAPQATGHPASQALVFIDAAVETSELLSQAVLPGVEVIQLEPNQDGITQITTALATRSQINALHLVSHGRSAQVQLGKTWLTMENLSTYAAQLQQWQQALSATASILLYGCEVAAGEAGKALIQQISAWVGVPVAAAQERVGSKALGGTWNLDVTTAPMVAELAFQSIALQSYPHTLGSPNIRIFDASIDEGNSGTSTLTFTLVLDAANSVATTVDYEILPDSATAGSDYSDALLTGTVTFAPNQTTQTITVDILGDVYNETSELFFVKLTNPTGGAGIADDTALGIILNDDPRPNLTIDDVTLSEDDSATKTATFTVTLSAPSNQFVSVNYRTVDGTATAADNDYTNTTGKLIFEPGETSKTITVPIIGDFKNEANETFKVTLSGATNAAITKGQGIGTINNNDALPTVGIGDTTVVEGGNATFTIFLSAASGQEIKVDYTTVDLTAKNGDDYSFTTNTLTFAPGETSKTITVSTVDDAMYEGGESFTVGLSGAINANIGTGTGTATLVDNDLMPALSIADVALDEGESGSQTLTFTLTLSAASGQPVTVQYATADETATSADGDYSPISGTVTFDPGQTSKTITVAVTGDQKYEPGEFLRLNLSNVSGATLANGSAIGTITNDDPQPTISIRDSSATLEGNSGNTTASFTITLSNPSNQAITVDYATAAGTADTSDYSPVSGSVTFNPGETSKTIEIQVKGDAVDEANETFQVDLSNATNATIGDGQGSGEITDDDGIPTIAITDVVEEETDGGTVAIFTVTLSNPTSSVVTVDYATADGTANAADYTSTTGTLTFAPGQTTQIITILISGDAEREADETFLVNLTNPTQATLGDGQATGTIGNDDPLPTITIDDVETVEGDNGSVNAVFTVSMVGTSSEAVVVNYTTMDDTAKAGTNDYIATAGSLTFNPGETSKTITVAVQGDQIQESNETFFVTLSSNQATILDNQGRGTIKTDETPPTLSIEDIQITEGNTGSKTAIFTVTLSQPSTEIATVRYATLGDTASALNGDYTNANGLLTFNPGDLSKTIEVAVQGDTLSEADEFFQVELFSPTQATLAKAQATGTILNDDPPPTLSIQNASVIEGNDGTLEALFTVSLGTISDRTVSLNYATTDETAKANDNDYLPTNGTLNFLPGEQSKTISVKVNGDGKLELDETFRLNLTNPIAATIINGSAVGTITNDDSIPSLAIDNITLTEGNTGTTAATFTVTLSAPSSQSIRVDYTTVDGSATLAEGDYQPLTQTLNFAPGEIRQTITVLVNGDLTVEANETFSVNLSNPQNAAIAQGQGTATVNNDDRPASTPTQPAQPVPLPPIQDATDQPFPEQTGKLDLKGNAQDNQLQGGSGNDTLDGAGGDDVINGGDGDDILYGREGNDQLSGGDGDDILYGGRNQDEIYGGQGKDRLFGGKGNDLLVGSAGGDELYGREGNDTLLGKQGNDFLSGGLGRDRLTGGIGQDRLRGGNGQDQFQFLTLEEQGDVFSDFAAKQDLLVVSARGFQAGLQIGKLQRRQFCLGENAIGKEDRFIYNAAMGTLYFDADGTGSSQQTLLATFSQRSALSHANISVIA